MSPGWGTRSIVGWGRAGAPTAPHPHPAPQQAALNSCPALIHHTQTVKVVLTPFSSLDAGAQNAFAVTAANPTNC